MHCGRFHPRPATRREMLARCANGFGGLALAALFGRPALSAAADGFTPLPPHERARARSVIFLFMDGGPSQVDTFDPKPRLDKEHGRPIQARVEPTQFNDVGTVLRSPWEFQPHGESGIPVSALFPHVARCVDKLAMIRSMVSNFSEHTNANYFIHTGHGQQGRPSAGAWITYGLGTESQNLPGFIVLNNGMIPPGGMDCFHSGFLPAAYQASVFQNGEVPLADLAPLKRNRAARDNKRRLLRRLDAEVQEQSGDPQIEAAIANYELAFRMQTAVPGLADISQETRATQEMYGVHDAPTAAFGRQCLLARRLVEQGVRFVEVLCPSVGHDRWDQHSNLKNGHEANARATDQPTAALLRDLEARGLLEETLVLWGGEFGRTPMAQGSDGRDHNPFGFTVWLAGGGIKGGTVYGATDDYGYHAVENRTTIHDLHATMLHLLGMDHKKLTFRFSGRDMRLTDVHGEVAHGILA